MWRPEKLGLGILLGSALGWASLAAEAKSAEGPDLASVLERMKAMEERISEQAREISSLKGQLRTAEAVSERRPVVDAAVDKALAQTPTPVSVFHDASLHPRALRFGGYMDFTYQYNLNRPDTRTNVARVFDSEDSNGFNLHLAEIDIDGSAQKPGEAGFRVDLAFGTDARKMHAFDRGDLLTSTLAHTQGGVASTDPAGNPIITDSNADTALLDNHTLASLPNDRQLDLQQAYVDYIAPVGKGIYFRFGKCATPLGQEVIESQDNWNSSRSMTFGFLLPFTHTGLSAEYQVFENWRVKGFLVNGWDTMQDNNDGKSGILQSVWSPRSWFTWTLTAAAGNEQTENDKNARYLVNTTLSFTPWKNWAFAAEGTWLHEKNAGLNRTDATGGGPEDETAYSLVGYAKWSFLKNWYAALRGEFINDLGGARLGIPMKVFAGTATVSWTPAPPMEIRFEYRHDNSSENPFADTESGAFAKAPHLLPTRGGRSTQDTLMTQWLYKF